MEDGVQVEFAAGTYRTGDYWMIPVRSFNGSVEWSQEGTGPRFEPRHGIEHHYAPLALLQLADDGAFWTVESDRRKLFSPLADEPRIQVAGVFLQSTKQPLEANDVLPVDELAKGIRVACETKVDPDTVSDGFACLVTLNIPFPWGTAGTDVLGFQPLTLEAGEPRVGTSDKEILWNASDTAKTWLTEKLFEEAIPDEDRSKHILAHLTLKDSAFELWFRVKRSGEAQMNIGFIPNKQSELFLDIPNQPDRRTLMSEAFNLAIDRPTLSRVLPRGYRIDSNQSFDPQGARRGVRFLMDFRGLQDTSGIMVVDEPFVNVGNEVANMLRGIPEVPIRLDREVSTNVVERVKKLISDSAGKQPAVVICDEDLAGSLAEDAELSANFGNVELIRF